MSNVYWLHIKEHTDMLTQGYIGVCTGTVEKRFSLHKHMASKGKNYPVSHAIRKYGSDIIVEKILEGPSEYCFEVEGNLRKIANTGWNLAVGGSMPMLGRKHSEESKSKMRETKRLVREAKPVVAKPPKQRRVFSDAHKAALSLANKGKKPNRKPCNPWNSPRSIPYVWKCADMIYLRYLDNPAISYRGLDREFKGSTAKLVKLLRNGWVPFEDAGWLEFKEKD